MNSVFFGIANEKYDEGEPPAVAVNANGVVVEVHETQGTSGKLWYRVARVNGSEIEWKSHGTIKDDEGSRPSVAVNAHGVVFEAHDSGHGTLWYWIGQASGETMVWGEHHKYDDGKDPAVALNDAGQLVEVHGDGTLWYWVGRVSGGKVAWTEHDKVKYDDGRTPAVAINNRGQVVEVHDSGHGTLWYWVGQISNDKLSWTGHAEYDDGCNPSVALTDDGDVIEVHESQRWPGLWQRIGRISGSSIIWQDWLGQGQESYYFDSGVTPSVAIAGRTAVQAHQSDGNSGLFATASLWFDRGNWMGNNLGTLGDRPLSALAIPATHDSGMYTYGLAALGKTQDLNLYGQLLSGARYFDLRPAKQLDGTLIVYHGDWGKLHVDGPPLSEILADIQRFMQAAGRELVILKFSHFAGFDQSAFEDMCNKIHEYLGNWLYTATRPQSLPRNSWLSDQTLNTYVKDRGACLVVCDSTSYTPPASLANAVWVYRDWYAGDPQDGDLTVFDAYSNTTSLDTMMNGTESDPDPALKPCCGLVRGQLPKFANFTGDCCQKYQNAPVKCGLFLLSWTLTPYTAVWPFSRTANAALGPASPGIGTNLHGRNVNLLYVDYTQYARVCDVALLRNGVPGFGG